MNQERNWPAALWLIRHGESAGNVARDAAEAAGLPMIEIAHRDVDVPLTELGERQARALGRWFGGHPREEQPTIVLSSPYLRAVQTARLMSEALPANPQLIQDERLREKEFGSLNRLTRAGIQTIYPEQWELRSHLGKFYYRPPGGESWCDVILRLRSVQDHIQLQYPGERVLIVAHQVVVLCFRYLLEKLTEQEILAIDRERDVANCSVTGYEVGMDAQGRSNLALRCYNFVSPLEEAGETVTEQPDPPVAAR